MDSKGITQEIWNAKVKVLQDLVDHQVDEEEKDMFPKVKKLMSKEWLEELGDKMLEFKKLNVVEN